jgi:NADPH2:quinone reductase
VFNAINFIKNFMKAIRIHQHGGPESLKYEEAPVPTPKANEALVKIAAIGVNFIDIYNRTGLYKVSLPFIPGREAAGVVETVGADVSEVRPGDRVAYAMEPGAYAEYAVIPAWKLVPLPEGISFESGAAAMLQGMTAHYLAHSTYPLKAGHTCLVHAAAGGVGLLLVKMAKRLGARVIGTVSTEAKAQLAKEAGADEVILYTQQDFEAEVKRLTNGLGVEVVYDSVGKTTYEKSLNCLAPRGYLVCFGQSSGPVPAIDPLVLSAKGSLFLTRASLAHYTLTREELLQRAGEVLKWVASGQLEQRIYRTLPLTQAAEAHRLLESRQTIGKLLLKP